MSNSKGEKTEFGPGKTALYYNNKGLFSDPFLEERLPNLEKYYNNSSSRFLNDYWNIDESDAVKYNKAFQEVMDLWHKLDQDVPKYCSKERQVQNTWIDPIFRMLGWTIELEETSSKHGVTNFPDYALFANVNDWKKFKELSDSTKFKRATAVADAKDWGVSLDGKGNTNKNPSFQIINYLKQTDKNWGILTDGKYWRIYSLRSDSKHTTFYEVDLEKILETGDYQRFKYFYNFFRVEAFVVDAKLSDRSFLDFVFEDGKFYAQLVDKNLNERVYKVVNSICQGFLTNYSNPNEDELKEIYENSMYYLFKLMFILNCESKGLLEVNKQDDYYEFSLRKKCMELKEQAELRRNWSSQPRTYNFIKDLFELLKSGDQKIGVHGFGNEPFDIGSTSFFKNNKIGDDYLNTALLDLACDLDDEGILQFIDYKILSPDHIGSLFEGLLEFKLVESKKGIELLNTKGDRKAAGAFYTPDYIVDYIVEETLKTEIVDKNPSEILNLNIIDPAMGSGHFLLGIVKYLERKIIEIQNTETKIKGAIEFDKIKKELLSKCIFGIDINPLATQLAKFQLWIYSSNKGDYLEPLSDQLLIFNSLSSDKIVKKLFPSEISSQGFDAVVGNPPWGGELTNEQRDSLAIMYPEVSIGCTNTFKFFCDQSYRLLRNNGVFGFIIPNTFLVQPKYSDLKKFFLKKETLKVVNLGDGIFGPKVNAPCAIVVSRNTNLSKSDSNFNLIDISFEEDKETALRNQRSSKLKKATSSSQQVKVELFSELVDAKDCGIKHQRKGCGLENKGKSDLADRLYYVGKRQNASDIPYINGTDLDISGYSLELKTDKYLRGNFKKILKKNETVYFNQNIMEKPKKLLWRQTADRPICAIGNKTYFANTLQAGLLTDKSFDLGISMEYLCCIMNSTWFRYLYLKKVMEKGRVFPQVKLTYLREMPIVMPSKKDLSTIENLYKEIMSGKSSALEKVNNIVFKLYGCTESEIKESQAFTERKGKKKKAA